MFDDDAKPTVSPLTVPVAIANLQSPEPDQRYYAAWWLGKMRVYEAVDALLAALENDDEGDRTELGGHPLKRNVARALGKLRAPKAIPALVRALSCEDFYVREAAAQAIENIATTPEGFSMGQVCIPLLTDMLRNATSTSSRLEEPYEAILEALGRLKAHSAREAIEPFLQHALPRIRFAAARAMYGLTEQPEFADKLIEGLASSDVNLRRVVTADLGAIAYLPAAAAIARSQVESSFKLFALKKILDGHLPHIDADPGLAESLQEVMLLMDDLL